MGFIVSLIVLDEPFDGLLDVLLEAVLCLIAKDFLCLVDAAPVLPDLPGFPVDVDGWLGLVASV